MNDVSGSKMVAFHGDPQIKEEYLARLREHAAADQIIKGVFWRNGKGCAVGCTVHSGRHEAYEEELGIPRALAKLEDSVFEGLPNEVSREFPIRFLSSIPVGVDLSMVVSRFLLWLLTDPDHGVIRFATGSRDSILKVGGLLERRLRGDEPTREEWSAAAYAAAAVYAAYAAAAYAAAAYAADAAAAYAADAVYASAYAYGRSAHYVVMADHLIDLLTRTEPPQTSVILR